MWDAPTGRSYARRWATTPAWVATCPSHAVDVASERLPAVRVFQSDVLGLSPGGDHDVITSFDVLEHVPDLDAALARLRAMLKPGGVLAIAVPVYDTPVGRLAGRLDKDPTHVHKLSRYEWLDRLDAAGFEQHSLAGHPALLLRRTVVPALVLARHPALQLGHPRDRRRFGGGR